MPFLGRLGARPGAGKSHGTCALVQLVQPLEILSHFTFLLRHVVHDLGLRVGPEGEALLPLGVILLRKGGDAVWAGEWLSESMVHFFTVCRPMVVVGF